MASMGNLATKEEILWVNLGERFLKPFFGCGSQACRIISVKGIGGFLRHSGAFSRAMVQRKNDSVPKIFLTSELKALISLHKLAIIILNKAVISMNKKIIFLMCLLMAMVWTAGCTCHEAQPRPVVAAPPPRVEPASTPACPAASGYQTQGGGARPFEEAEETRY